MIISQYESFLIFIILGIFIGFLFDLFRIIRKSYKTPDIITYLEDLMFWLISGIILLYSIFVFNKGEIRFYIFIGLFFGISFYILLFSKFVIKSGVIILKIFNKILIFPILKIMCFLKEKNIILLKKIKILQKK